MQKVRRRGPLLKHLDEIEARCKDEEISLKTVFEIFGSDGHYILIFFLILPFLQPIPLFGLSTPFGLLIGLVAYFAYLKKPPYIPKKWEEKKLPSKTVLKIAEGSERIFEKLSFILSPRLKVFFQGPFPLISSFLVIFNAVLLALPLPVPFSNAIPGWMILFQALGHLEEDGLLILISYIQTAISIVFFSLLIFGVTSGIHFLEAKHFFE